MVARAAVSGEVRPVPFHGCRHWFSARIAIAVALDHPQELVQITHQGKSVDLDHRIPLADSGSEPLFVDYVLLVRRVVCRDPAFVERDLQAFLRGAGVTTVADLHGKRQFDYFVSHLGPPTALAQGSRPPDPNAPLAGLPRAPRVSSPGLPGPGLPRVSTN